MAVLARMSDFNSHTRIQRLTFRLLYHYDLLNGTATNISNYTDAGVVVVETILDLSDLLNVDSVPGNEWERLGELKEYCCQTKARLLEHSTDRDTVLAGCREATEQYTYLLEMEDIDRAALIETLCLKGDNPWAATTTSSLMYYSNKLPKRNDS